MAAMESWGTELWDKYSELTANAGNGIDFLENYVARSVLNCNFAVLPTILSAMNCDSEHLHP